MADNLRLVDFHPPRYLHTHCLSCQALITISAAAAQIGGLIRCWRCDAPARVWQLIGRENRQEAPRVNHQEAPANPLAGTWEGARP